MHGIICELCFVIFIKTDTGQKIEDVLYLSSDVGCTGSDSLSSMTSCVEERLALSASMDLREKKKT